MKITEKLKHVFGGKKDAVDSLPCQDALSDQLTEQDHFMHSKMNEMTDQLGYLSGQIDTIQGSMDKILDSMRSGMDDTVDSIRSGMDGTVDSIRSGMGGMLDSMRSGMGGMLDSMRSSMDDALDSMRSSMDGALDSMCSSMGSALDSMCSGMDGTLDSMRSGMGGTLDSMHSDMGGALDSMRSNMDDALDSMLSSIGGTLDSMQDSMGDMLDSLSQIKNRLEEEKPDPFAQFGKQIKDLSSAVRRHDMALNDLVASWEETDATRKETQQKIDEIEGREKLLLHLLIAYQDHLWDLRRQLISDPAWETQFAYIEGALSNQLTAAGLTVLQQMETPVDYSLHEVMSARPTPYEELDKTVADIFRCGYVYRGEVIRKATVIAYRYDATLASVPEPEAEVESEPDFELDDADLNEDVLNEDVLNEDDLNEDDLNEDDLNEDDLNEDDLNEDDLNEDDLNEDDLNDDDLNEDDLNDDDLNDDDLSAPKSLYDLYDQQVNHLHLADPHDFLPPDELPEEDLIPDLDVDLPAQPDQAPDEATSWMLEAADSLLEYEPNVPEASDGPDEDAPVKQTDPGAIVSSGRRKGPKHRRPTWGAVRKARRKAGRNAKKGRRKDLRRLKPVRPRSMVSGNESPKAVMEALIPAPGERFPAPQEDAVHEFLSVSLSDENPIKTIKTIETAEELLIQSSPSDRSDLPVPPDESTAQAEKASGGIALRGRHSRIGRKRRRPTWGALRKARRKARKATRRAQKSLRTDRRLKKRVPFRAMPGKKEPLIIDTASIAPDKRILSLHDQLLSPVLPQVLSQEEVDQPCVQSTERNERPPETVETAVEPIEEAENLPDGPTSEASERSGLRMKKKQRGRRRRRARKRRLRRLQAGIHPDASEQTSEQPSEDAFEDASAFLSDDEPDDFMNELSDAQEDADLPDPGSSEPDADSIHWL